WTAVDTSGNSTICNQTVTVNDTEKPSIGCPGDITRTNDTGNCSAVVIYSISASDNCGVVSANQLAGLPSGAAFPVGVTTNVFKVSDAACNSNICSFTVTVTDARIPSITCPTNITTTNDLNQCSAVVHYTTPVGTDSCPGAVTTQIGGLTNGSAF